MFLLISFVLVFFSMTPVIGMENSQSAQMTSTQKKKLPRVNLLPTLRSEKKRSKTLPEEEAKKLYSKRKTHGTRESPKKNVLYSTELINLKYPLVHQKSKSESKASQILPSKKPDFETDLSFFHHFDIPWQDDYRLSPFSAANDLEDGNFLLKSAKGGDLTKVEMALERFAKRRIKIDEIQDMYGENPWQVANKKNYYLMAEFIKNYESDYEQQQQLETALLYNTILIKEVESQPRELSEEEQKQRENMEAANLQPLKNSLEYYKKINIEVELRELKNKKREQREKIEIQNLKINYARAKDVISTMAKREPVKFNENIFSWEVYRKLNDKEIIENCKGTTLHYLLTEKAGELDQRIWELFDRRKLLISIEEFRRQNSTQNEQQRKKAVIYQRSMVKMSETLNDNVQSDLWFAGNVSVPASLLTKALSDEICWFLINKKALLLEFGKSVENGKDTALQLNDQNNNES